MNQPDYLSLYGWNESLFRHQQKSAYQQFLPGRVTVTHKTCYEIISEQGFYSCELSGNMLYGRSQADYPCTGDWILFQPTDLNKGIILDILPREKTLYRLKSGTVSEQQAIASYVDKGFIVQSLDNNFNVRRIERFMLQLAAENIQPVLILSKTDLGFNRNDVSDQLKHLQSKLPIFYTSTQSASSIDLLRSYIQAGETVVFIGSSGVGKSTLINELCQKKSLATSAISVSTGKGKHTSTRREMVLLNQSGILIDTPGIKVFGVTHEDDSTLSELFDLKRWSSQCKFSDCQHINEQGCAVLLAVENGYISKEVYNNYLKLRKEASHYNLSVHEKRKKEKKFSRMVQEVKNNSYKKYR